MVQESTQFKTMTHVCMIATYVENLISSDPPSSPDHFSRDVERPSAINVYRFDSPTLGNRKEESNMGEETKEKKEQGPPNGKQKTVRSLPNGHGHDGMF